jgi:hypothetical protein
VGAHNEWPIGEAEILEGIEVIVGGELVSIPTIRYRRRP